MIKIVCLNQNQFDFLIQLFLDKEIKFDSDPMPVPGRIIEPLSIIVDLDELTESIDPNYPNCPD